MTVYEGGKAYSGTVVSSGGNLVLSSGGVANDVTLADSAAFLYVMGGGEANDIKINNRGQTMIFSGGTVNSASFDHGSASVQGVLNSASVANWGLLLARSGGTINNAAVYDLGELRVSQGGFANNITVNSGGVLTGYDNGRIYNATINSGGELSLYSGINLSSATVRSGGWAFVNGAINVVNFVVNGTIYVSSGGRMEQTPGNFTLGSGAMLKISKGGYVDGANVRSGAQVTVESGGTFGAEISGGRVMARTGALLDGVILKSGSVLEAAAYAGLKDVVVSSGGSVTGALRKTQNLTFSGGTLDLNIAMASENDDYLVDSASYADFKTDSYDVTLSIANKQMNGAYKLITGASGFNKTITVKFIGNVLGTLTVNGGPTNVGGVTCDLTLNSGNLVVTVTGGAIPDPIYSGATLIDERKDITSGMSAIDIKVSSGGILNVFSSGIASNTTVYADGEFNLNSKGILRDATIHSGGTATIYEDTRTQNVVVDGGTLNVESDAFITFTSSGKLVSSNVIVSNGGKLNLNGGWVEGALISGGQVMIVSEGSMFAASVANGDVLAKDGGFAGMTIMDGGVVTLASGGTGSCTVSSGGTMRLEDGSDLHGLRVLEGGVVTGVMHGIYSVVTFYKGTLDLDISGVAPSNEYLYDMDANLDFSHGMSCTLTVKGYQENGTYNLMESAYEYDTQVITAETPLTVKGTDGSELGTLTVGQTAYINGASYTLNLSSDHHLTITIEGATPPPPTPTPGSAKSDVDGNGISDVLFQYTGGFGQIGFWMNGTSEWKSTNSTHPTDVWEVLGAYDMNANGKADSVLVGNTEISGIKGAFIGYYLDAEDFDSNWVNISYLTNSEGYVWKNKVGNLTGNAGMNSIVWHCTDIGALGVWTDGTDNWMSLGAGYDSNWTLIGCGDFDGNGKDSVVMSYLNGAKYYTVDLDETLEGDKGVAKELATSDSGWAVRAIGDFSGDGKDDIVAFHQETGLVAMWGDGDSAKWSQLGQLDAADWFVVGAGDYNGDAKDDLLVRQYSTGMLGYYTSGDMAQWNVLGYGVDMSWTVIA